MDPITWGAALAGLAGLLASLPKILGYIDRIVAAYEKVADAAQRAALNGEIANRVEYAKQNKDTSYIENFFRTGGRPVTSPPKLQAETDTEVER
jgi:hypothetical protein